uniref:WAT1-related protein n=1 Tax=Zea mays TaxID=4577 RepID=A0A804QZF0_MAIZE
MWMISAGRMEQWAPTAAMVATNVVIAVMTALIKQALSLGMNRLVLITFRQMVATLFLGPIAYFKERRMRPKFTSEIFVYMFLSGILGPVLLQYTLFVGLDYTTATFAATFGNMLPVVTFLISLAFSTQLHQVRSTGGEEQVGERQDLRDAHLPRRRNDAHLLQGFSTDTNHHRRHVVSSIQRRRPHQATSRRARHGPVGAGLRLHAGQRRRLRAVAAPAAEVHPQVPGRVLGHGVHVAIQLRPGRGAGPVDPEDQPCRVGPQGDRGDRHGGVLWCSGVWHWVPAAHLLRGEERPRVHCRLQPARPDLRRRHRSLHPPRASLPRKVMTRPQRNNAAHRSTHHSLLAHKHSL